MIRKIRSLCAKLMRRIVPAIGMNASEIEAQPALRRRVELTVECESVSVVFGGREGLMGDGNKRFRIDSGGFGYKNTPSGYPTSKGVGTRPGTLHRVVSGPTGGVCAINGDSSDFSVEERQIVSLVVGGFANRSIAGYLSLSESTVHRRIAGICRKLGASNRIELVLCAIDREIIR